MADTLDEEGHSATAAKATDAELHEPSASPPTKEGGATEGDTRDDIDMKDGEAETKAAEEVDELRSPSPQESLIPPPSSPEVIAAISNSVKALQDYLGERVDEGAFEIFKES
jgi:hypothetical protein